MDKATGDLLWHDLVDPELMSPEGLRAVIRERDLLVFSPTDIHVVRSLETPRISEAVFFEAVT